MLDKIFNELSWLAKGKDKLSTWNYALVMCLVVGTCHAYFYDKDSFGLATIFSSVLAIFTTLLLTSFASQRVLRFRQRSSL